MPIAESLLQICRHEGESYAPVVDYDQWRVAMIRFADHFAVENLHQFERHNATDEVFVLLQGQGVLLIGDGDEEVGAIHLVKMEPLCVYNVRRAVWHMVNVGHDGVLLIVENRDTSDANSEMIFPPDHQLADVKVSIRALLAD